MYITGKIKHLPKADSFGIIKHSELDPDYWTYTVS